ncbi:hypothetical protein H1R20_g5712, partial [Candolleomyces eurysporus]
MLDTYDAPMSDYASDIDVFMQTHSDSWNQDDGTMDDDSFNAFNEVLEFRLKESPELIDSASQTDPIKPSGMELVVSADPTHASFDLSLEKEPLLARDAAAVEVEMEEYVEEAHEHEYEMVDDNEDNVHEIQDIEVADAHLTGVDGNHSPQISYSLSNETSASIVEITSLVTPNPAEEVSHLDSLPTQDASESYEITSITHDHSETSSAAIDTSLPTDSHPVSLLSDENADTGTANDQETAESSHGKLGTSLDNPDPPTEGNEEGHLENPSEPVAAEIVAPVIPSDLDPAHDVVSAAEAPQAEQPREDTTEEQPHGDHDGTAGSPSANPHEISEGVFIEPPPPIMIELPWGEDTYSIFNRPSPPSGRSTPAHDDSVSNSDIIVLLHQQPTLFYEPLHSVFEALRQEEAFYSLADLREVELIFSIPSLKLAVSEDNVYASHVSLHDLSLLHDTLGGTGPLRMQLQIQTPRFTLRYDQLQEHMHQTVLGDDTDTAHAPPEQDLSNSDDNAINDSAEYTVNAESKPPSDDLPSHEFPQPELQDQHPPEDDHAPDAAETANQDEVTTEEQPSELGAEPDTVELIKSDGDGPVFEEAEEEFVESAGHQVEEEEEVTHAEQDHEHESDDHPPASLADDQNLEAEDQEYPQDGAEEEESNYEEEEEEEDSDATTEVPEVDGFAENELAEANTLDQPSEEVDPNVDEASEHHEESTAQAPGSPRHTDIVTPSERVDHESEVVEETSSGDHDEDTEAKSTNESEDLANETYSKADDELEQVDEAHNFANLPELPEDDEFWDEELDGEGEVDLDATYDDDQQNGSPSNDSSVTLSSKGSKRGYSELDGEYDDEEFDLESIHSPVLIQHNIVWHVQNEGEPEMFEVNVDECLMRLRYGRYILQADQLFGKAAADIVQIILDHGKLLPPQIFSLLQISDSKTLSVYNQALRKLVSGSYLRASTPLSHVSPKDRLIQYEIEEKKKIAGFPTAKQLREAKEVAEARLKREDDEAEKVGLKRKAKDQPGYRASKKKAVEEETVVDDEVYFRINCERFNVHVRNSLIITAAKERFNPQTATVLEAALKATDKNQLVLSDVRTEPISISNVLLQLSDTEDLSAGLVYSSKKVSQATCIKDYLGMLSSADNPTPAGKAASFISFGGSKVQVEFEVIARRLRRHVLESVTREKHGPEGVRILRLLLDTGKMDEKQISKVVLMAAKDVRPLLAALSADSLISTQEVPKSADRNPTRTFYLWYVDLYKAYAAILGNAFKTLHNISARRRADREVGEVKAVLDKCARTDVQQDESLLTRMEREVLKDWREREQKLTVLEGRVEELVFILRDLAVYGNSDD